MKFGLRSTIFFLSVLAAGAVLAIGAVLLWNSRDTTIYSDGFSEERFRQVKRGMVLEDVYALLGQPLGFRPENSPERWCYGKTEMLRKSGGFVIEDFLSPPQCVLFDQTGAVLNVTGNRLTKITKGMTRQEVSRLLGKPDRLKPASAMTLHYTAPGGEGLFRARIIAVNARNRVSDVVSYEFYD